MMYSIPDAKSAEEVYNILEMIEKTEEPGIKGNFIIIILLNLLDSKHYLHI